MRRGVTSVVVLLMISTLALVPRAAADSPETGQAIAELRKANGDRVGTAKFIQESDGKVIVRVLVHDIPAGFHGFHIHAIGVCDSTTTPPFTSAGGHFNPTGAVHRGHAGDLPPLLVNADGTAMARFKTDRFAVADLSDSDGSALILHALRDNFANIPARYAPFADAATNSTGDAGGRIACGVISEGGGSVRVSERGSTQAFALLRDTAGAAVGIVTLRQQDGAVFLRAVVHDLPAGFHGFHVHAVGACSPDFTAAGGHFNPTGGIHGGHAGDLPALLVNSDGTAEARFATDRFEIGDLFDSDGSAFIIHALADNYANIPSRYAAFPDSTTNATGDSGARLACGVIS